jgi:predicted ribosome quality control (RQC) complex YloA/Tae2 family protein
MRWDAPLAAATAAALATRLTGARLRAFHPEFEARRLRLYFREATLVALLHPGESGLLLLDPTEPTTGARPLAAHLRGVEALPDDRVLVLSFQRARGHPAETDLVLELLTNQENWILTEGPDRIVRTLLRTRTAAGPEPGRELVVGRPWAPPPASTRAGIAEPVPLAAWVDALEPPEPGRRRGALLAGFAWTSAVNAPALLGAAARPEAGPQAARAALEAGWRSWVRLGEIARGEAPAEPVLLEGPRGLQPYPVPLAGLASRPAPDLLDALREATGPRQGGPGTPAHLPAALLEALERRVGRARGRVAALEEEASTQPDPAELRATGDLLLARYAEIPSGASSVVLRGFEGEPVTVALDPALPPAANAAACYERAARAERARERQPGQAREARTAWQALEALLERARAGEAGVAELEAALPDPRPGEGGGEEPTLPYRRYRSSGGLEIRVGRGSRRNDDLTFRHSAPDDIWLHARHASGAHVILRWNRAENPPARDLAEAAVLAALHSRARTSGSVPVDWTRRKHVRKPRKAAPGAVVPDRVATLFVEPNPALEERLRSE